MAAQEPTTDAVLHDASALIATMRQGFRSAVQAFVDHLDKVGLFVPLAKPLAGVEVGQAQQMGDELTLAPHLLPLADDWVVALWSDRDQLQTVGQYLQWTTDGEHLDLCYLPARVALEFALQLIDDDKVKGLVLNPGDESEVFLSRQEAASIASNKAIPLVGYVQNIPEQPREQTLVSELDAPLPPDLLQLIEHWVKRSDLAGYQLQQTFNAERDLEPHLTLLVKKGPAQSADERTLIAPLLSELEGKLPPPGYIDVLFE
ncbi:MAG TPA: hypothetical protein VL137_13490 [Polyangiaceae bacterium]|jgi:hypothetical protein|nr:hypothetical protein [Polyangiaceae bacterium]